MKRWKWWILSLLDEPRGSNRHSHQSYEEEHEEGVEEQVRREGGGVSAVAFLCSSSSTSSIRRGVRAPPRVIKNPLRVFQTRETKYKLAAARLAGGVTKGEEQACDTTNASPPFGPPMEGARNSGHVCFVDPFVSSVLSPFFPPSPFLKKMT